MRSRYWHNILSIAAILLSFLEWFQLYEYLQYGHMYYMIFGIAEAAVHHTIWGAVCFQFTHSLCDDWENIYVLSYYHHQIGSMNYFPFLGLGRETMLCAVCLSIFLVNRTVNKCAFLLCWVIFCFVFFANIMLDNAFLHHDLWFGSDAAHRLSAVSGTTSWCVFSDTVSVTVNGSLYEYYFLGLRVHFFNRFFTPAFVDVQLLPWLTEYTRLSQILMGVSYSIMVITTITGIFTSMAIPFEPRITAYETT